MRITRFAGKTLTNPTLRRDALATGAVRLPSGVLIILLMTIIKPREIAADRSSAF